MSPLLHVEAPTDAQLHYLHDLCEQRGIVPPLVVGSKEDCRHAITAILERTSLEPWQYDPAGFWSESVPF